MRRINDDFRKRSKNKNTEGSANQPKNYGSATILLNTLINAEPEPKED